MSISAKARKKQRLILIVIALVLLAGAVGLMLRAFNDNIVFFISPTEVVEQHKNANDRFRLGGMVEEGSVRHEEEGLVTVFTVTDFNNSISVFYRGIVPDLFREGQGVIAEGRLDATGMFVADTVLAKHDEKYMPPEVADMLEKNKPQETTKEEGAP